MPRNYGFRILVSVDCRLERGCVIDPQSGWKCRVVERLSRAVRCQSINGFGRRAVQPELSGFAVSLFEVILCLSQRTPLDSPPGVDIGV